MVNDGENKNSEQEAAGTGQGPNGDGVNSSNDASKGGSIVDEAKALRDEIRSEKEALIKERKALENARAETILGGKADTGQAPEKKPEESDHDYRVRIEKEMAGGKTEFGD